MKKLALLVAAQLAFLAAFSHAAMLAELDKVQQNDQWYCPANSLACATSTDGKTTLEGCCPAGYPNITTPMLGQGACFDSYQEAAQYAKDHEQDSFGDVVGCMSQGYLPQFFAQ